MNARAPDVSRGLLPHPAAPGCRRGLRARRVAARGPSFRVRRGDLHYPRLVHVAALPAKPRGLAMMLGWRRIRFALGISIVIGLLLGIHWKARFLPALTRTVFLGLIAMM